MVAIRNLQILPMIFVIGSILIPLLEIQGAGRMSEASSKEGKIKLPEPRFESPVSIEEVLFKRRSIRRYKDKNLKLSEISQLLWAAQGITDKKRGLRTAPSAGALYPLEVYLAVGNVSGVPFGIYKYKPRNHEIVKIKEGDLRSEISRAALRQSCVEKGAVDIIIVGVYKRTTQKYGERGFRYVHMEAGHVAQNVYLQAVALGLGTVVVGAFQDEMLKKVLNMPDGEFPLYIMPVGRK